MKIEDFIAKFIEQDLPQFAQDLKVCRTVRQIVAWKKKVVKHVESQEVDGEDTLRAYEDI